MHIGSISTPAKANIHIFISHEFAQDFFFIYGNIEYGFCVFHLRDISIIPPFWMIQSIFFFFKFISVCMGCRLFQMYFWLDAKLIEKHYLFVAILIFCYIPVFSLFIFECIEARFFKQPLQTNTNVIISNMEKIWLRLEKINIE